MTSAVNPFRPGAGRRPPYLAGREREQGQFLAALKSLLPNGEGQVLIMYGPRGTGKTVLLNWFGRECDKAGVVALKTTPSTGLHSREALAELLLPRDWLPREVSIDLAELFSAGWTRPNTNAHGLLSDHLIDACRSKPRVLLVDEAHTLDPDVCRSLLNTSQTVSNAAPFLLVLAGTPGLHPFLMSVGATFIERSHMMGIGRLDRDAAAQAIGVPLRRDNIVISEGTLLDIADDAQCYPYFLQLWGEGLWNAAVEHGVTDLTETEVEAARPIIDGRRVGFHEGRYEVMENDLALELAAIAVAKAFQEQEKLYRKELIAVIENSLPAKLTDEPARRHKAQRLESELHRIDYVWRPPNASLIEPGLPSLMKFVRLRDEQNNNKGTSFRLPR